MKLRLKVCFIVCMVIFAGIVQAKHIVGGVMSYQCLGNNQYRFTLKVYRDCAGGGAPFDSPAQIGVYLCGNTINCVSLNQKATYAEPDVLVGDEANIPPPVYPCLTVPPVVCVEEAVYVFNLNLPKSVNSYHVVYQRCCRNNTISNIIDPENSGATFTIEVTPEAQQFCNSSPVFNEFPPTLICANEPLNFDHSASDPDGDQLVYELCAPLLGGGPNGTPGNPGNAAGCNGVVPGPACPPPFSNVLFAVPGYSYDKPLGTGSQISIDPVTGLLKVKPSLIGQFVVGVCVSEYRNGVLLSKVRRDFQFNVTNCEPIVNAAIKNDEIVGNQQFVVNSCGSKVVDFINQSSPKSNIFSYEWHFEDGTPQTVTSLNSTITFPDIGTYKGTMIVNKGTVCADTAIIFVNIYPDIKADFVFDYDTCTAGPVQYTDKSYSEAGKIENWIWDFSDGSLSSETNPGHEFNAPGNYPVKLKVFDLNGCSDSLVKNVAYYPVPPVIIIKPSSFIGCVPANIKFINESYPLDSTYEIIWNFGDGGTIDAVSPDHLYNIPGIYDISINITSPIGCKTSAVFNKLIKIEPSPTADFDYTPSDPSNINPVVTFQDASKYAVSWGWDFGDGGKSFIQNPIHTFKDTGMYSVTLYVKHQSGCLDTLTKILDVKPIITYFLPNAFTPNGDGINDEFKGKGFFLGMENFELSIWNRWGEKIFVTNDPNDAWDGRVNNQGNFVQNGVYVVKVRYKGSRGDEFQLSGFATVIK